MLAFITGILIQPKTAPTSQTGTDLPKARKKFSVLIEINSVLQIMRTRLFGAGIDEAITLPRSSAIPVAVLTIPSAASPPPSLERSMAGNAALYIDAVKLIAARNRIKPRMPRLCFSYSRPPLADCNTVSLLTSLSCIFGILTKHNNEMKATAKVIKSKNITACMLNKDSTAVAITGVRILIREFENERIPLAF